VPPEQSEELHTKILKEAAAGDGSLEIVHNLNGVYFNVRKGPFARSLNNGQAPRELAEIQEAVDVLISNNWIRLIKQRNDDFFYKVTHSGYQEAKR